MIKEIVISSVIIVSMFILNFITEDYTKYSIDEMSRKFDNIREDLLNGEEKEKEQLVDMVEEVISDWEKYNGKLSYYIEHDELEKVNTHLVALKSNVETEEYEQGVENLDVCVFILEHIDDKEAFMLRNIF